MKSKKTPPNRAKNDNATVFTSVQRVGTLSLLFVPSAEGGGMEIKMNLNEFLKEEAFSKYNVGIEKN